MTTYALNISAPTAPFVGFRVEEMLALSPLVRWHGAHHSAPVSDTDVCIRIAFDAVSDADADAAVYDVCETVGAWAGTLDRLSNVADAVRVTAF